MTEEIKDKAKNEAEVEVSSEEQEATIDSENNNESGECENSPDHQEKPQQEEVDWKDKYLRLHADWENYRKRMDEQRADERARATEKLVCDLIPLIDDMNHALDYASKNEGGDLTEGFQAISTKFWTSLEKHGLKEIDPAGEAFDPIKHQAVSKVEDAEVYEETVKDVYQKGYQLGIKVIRPAMVTVTTGGEKRPKEEPKTTEQDTSTNEEVNEDANSNDSKED
jgi:molecular chaperone GrpE